MSWQNKLRSEIISAIENSKNFYLTKDERGCYYGEIYADYRDHMDGSTAIKILNSPSPMDAFYETMNDWYLDAEWSYRKEISDVVQEALCHYDNGAYPNGLNFEEAEFLNDWITENIYFNYPTDHYLKQSFYTTIMVDTGDGNYDYTLNAHYPCYYGGRKGEAMDDKASLVWLAKQQGYTKGQLRKALDDGDMANPNGFLESCRVEMANMTSHMQVLTFLVKMDLETLIKINRLIQIRDENGHQYDATKYGNYGHIALEKNTMCGLFDPWNGGGSVLEIQLEKDINIPIKFIRSCLPDGGDGYGVDEVYGLCGSAWKDSLQRVHIPQKIKHSAEV